MGAILLVPFLLIRFGLLSMLNKEAVSRAAHFPPMAQGARPAYWLYQFSTVALFVSMFFLRIRTTSPALFYAGIAVCMAGIVLLTASVVSFTKPSEEGMCRSGPYRFSRNPMYVAYFLFFLGCALLTQSLLLLGILLVFQGSAHWLILAEERWCSAQFGETYLGYMRSVRRYF